MGSTEGQGLDLEGHCWGETSTPHCEVTISMTIYQVPRELPPPGKEMGRGNLPCAAQGVGAGEVGGGNRGVKEPNRTFVPSGRAEGLGGSGGPKRPGLRWRRGGGVSANSYSPSQSLTGNRTKEGELTRATRGQEVATEAAQQTPKAASPIS